MRSAIAIHLAVTFEPPGGGPPSREDDPSGSTKGNNLPPIQRPAPPPPILVDVPPGARPRIDLFVTIATDPEEQTKLGEPKVEQTPVSSKSGEPQRREEAKIAAGRRKSS